MKKFTGILPPSLLLAFCSSLAAATYQWDVNDSAAGLGGDGTWSNSNAFWDEFGAGSDDGTDSTVAYTFMAGDTALFGGTAGTVTLNSGATIPAAITFLSGGYTFTVGGNSSRTFSGLVTVAPTGTTTIQSTGNNSAQRFNGGVDLNGGHLIVRKRNDGPSGSSSFNGGVSGNGTLELREVASTATFNLGANTYSGSTLLTGGFANANAATAFGTSTVTFQGTWPESPT